MSCKGAETVSFGKDVRLVQVFGAWFSFRDNDASVSHCVAQIAT